MSGQSRSQDLDFLPGPLLKINPSRTGCRFSIRAVCCHRYHVASYVPARCKCVQPAGYQGRELCNL